MEVKKQDKRLEDIVDKIKDIFSKGEYVTGEMTYSQNPSETGGENVMCDYEIVEETYSCMYSIGKDDSIMAAEKGRVEFQENLRKISGNQNIVVLSKPRREGHNIKTLEVYPTEMREFFEKKKDPRWSTPSDVSVEKRG